MRQTIETSWSVPPEVRILLDQAGAALKQAQALLDHDNVSAAADAVVSTGESLVKKMRGPVMEWQRAMWDSATGRCLVTLFATPTGWVAYLPDGRYKMDGDLQGTFWHAVNLCRFEPGELDPYVPGLRLPMDHVFAPAGP